MAANPGRGRKVAFGAVVAVGFLGAVELAARVLLPSPAEREGVHLDAHPTRGWELRDRASSEGVSFRLGEHGLREVRKTGAPLKILTTGDSSIFGHGLADEGTLHEQLRRSLGERQLHVDVLTAGVPGYTSSQTLVQMEEFGWSLGVDLLVVGNLWSDSDFATNEAEANLQGTPSGAAPEPPPRGPLFGSRAVEALREALGGGPEEIGWITPDAPEGPRRVKLDEYAANLDRIFEGAAQRGIGALLLTPCNRELAAEVEAPPRGWPWDPYFEMAPQVAAARGVPVVEGCEVARSAGLMGDAAFLDEMHPTAALNEAYGEAIANRLVELGWPGARLLPRERSAELPVVEDIWGRD